MLPKSDSGEYALEASERNGVFAPSYAAFGAHLAQLSPAEQRCLLRRAIECAGRDYSSQTPTASAAAECRAATFVCEALALCGIEIYPVEDDYGKGSYFVGCNACARQSLGNGKAGPEQAVAIDLLECIGAIHHHFDPSADVPSQSPKALEALAQSALSLLHEPAAAPFKPA